MAESTQFPGSGEQFNDILLQVNFDSPEKKADKETGLRIAQSIYTSQTGAGSNNLNFFNSRSQRWWSLERWANGTQDMTEFLDYFNIVDGNKAYAKIDLTPIMVGPQFVNTLIESMAKNKEYACVKAVDRASLTEREQDRLDALYRMHFRDEIEEMQKATGMQLEPIDAYVPEDELSAEVYFELEYRQPKEIKFEQILDRVQAENDYEKVYKRRAYRDLIVNNIEVNKIERLPTGKYYIRKCIPRNVIYNFFLGETGKMELSYIGEVYNLKVRDLRLKYGVSPTNPNGLTEKQIFDIAKLSTTKTTNAIWTYQWRDEFTYTVNRPWDDYNIQVFDFEIQIQDAEYYVSKEDSFGKENITPKKGVPQPKSDKAKIIKKNKNTWYRGVYCPKASMMIYWGEPDIVIYPYMNMYEGLSSYTINIPNNNGEYVPSLFERGLEILKTLAISTMKRKQLISKVRPTGIRIDIESARNLDIGAGNTIPWEEVVRIYDHTGNEVWSSRGLNPNERESPAISPGVQDDSLQKIMGMTQTIESLKGELRQVWGVPVYRDGSDVGDRTAARLAEGQNASSFNVTDFIVNAHRQAWEDTLYKLCILHWQDVIKTGDKNEADELINTMFDVRVEMKMTDYEREILERNIDVWSKTIDGNGNPLLSPKDVLTIRNIDNYKLAERYLANIIEKNKKRAMQESAMLQEQNAKVQQASMEAAEQAKLKALQDELMFKSQLADKESKEKKEQILLQGIFDLYKAGIPIPESIKPVEKEVFQSVQMSLFVENKESEMAIDEGIQQAMQEQQMMMQQQMQPQQGMEQPMQPQM